jgi:ABC-type multidrug transport system ATPase subunit
MLTQQEVSSAGLNLEGLSISAPDGRALISSANMSFYPGVTALTGPNGCGKSTLLRAIAMLHPVDGGTISLGRLEGSSDRSGFLSQLVFMPQNFPVYPTMTAQEFLEYPLRLRGAATAQARAIAAEWLQTVGLQSAAKALCGTYSQGMRQRLGLACALQLDVPLYLLDEPFAGVDAEWREVMLDLLFRLCADRIALISTHHVDEVLRRGANHIQLSQGQLVMACPAMR